MMYRRASIAACSLPLGSPVWIALLVIEFRPVGSVYNTLHLPEGFEISVARLAATYKMGLKGHFRDSALASTTSTSGSSLR